MAEQKSELPELEAWGECPPNLSSIPGSIKPKDYSDINPLHLEQHSRSYLANHPSIKDSAQAHKQSIGIRYTEYGSEFLIGEDIKSSGVIILFDGINYTPVTPDIHASSMSR